MTQERRFLRLMRMISLSSDCHGMALAITCPRQGSHARTVNTFYTGRRLMPCQFFIRFRVCVLAQDLEGSREPNLPPPFRLQQWHAENFASLRRKMFRRVGGNPCPPVIRRTTRATPSENISIGENAVRKVRFVMRHDGAPKVQPFISVKGAKMTGARHDR